MRVCLLSCFLTDTNRAEKTLQNVKQVREGCNCCGFAPQEAMKTPMRRRETWTEEDRVEVQELPLHQTSLVEPATRQSVSAVRGTERWPISLRTSRYCLSFDFSVPE